MKYVNIYSDFCFSTLGHNSVLRKNTKIIIIPNSFSLLWFRHNCFIQYIYVFLPPPKIYVAYLNTLVVFWCFPTWKEQTQNLSLTSLYISIWKSRLGWKLCGYKYFCRWKFGAFWSSLHFAVHFVSQYAILSLHCRFQNTLLKLSRLLWAHTVNLFSLLLFVYVFNILYKNIDFFGDENYLHISIFIIQGLSSQGLCSRSDLQTKTKLQMNERNPLMIKSGVDVMKQILLQDLLRLMSNLAWNSL